MNKTNNSHTLQATKQNTPSTPESTNPIKQIVEVMQKVDTKSPEAKQNEVSIKDKNGNRIKLNDEEVRFDYFKGTFVPITPVSNDNDKKK